VPEYEFFNEDGEYRAVFFHMADAPTVGQIIDHEGESLRRVASSPTIKGGFKPFSSMSQALWDPDAPNHDSKGVPYYSSERDVRHYIEKNNNNPCKKKQVWDG